MIEHLYGFPGTTLGHSLLVNADATEWLQSCPDNFLTAVVTDPPFGIEYDPDQIKKKEENAGGKRVHDFFLDWTTEVFRVLKPGGHAIIASNAYLSLIVFDAVAESGLEFRGEVIRLVRTLRGGDRPKGADREFPDICSMPRGLYEPWGLFRKPLPKGKTVADCLRTHGTGALRRITKDKPFEDVIVSERTPATERRIANHPNIKPQAFMRQIVRAMAPCGSGIIADPFCGSGATIAAAEHLGIPAIGIERDARFYEMAQAGIPRLSHLPTKN